MNEMRVMAPEPEDSSKSLARVVRGVMQTAFTFLDREMIPPKPQNTDYVDCSEDFEPGTPPRDFDGPGMYHIDAARFVKHIKRIEYLLRCVLFFLACRLIADPQTRARLSAAEPIPRMPPQRRPYDPDMMVQLTQPALRASFASLPYPSRGPSRSGRRSRYTPLDWKEVEISHLIARLEQFPKVLNTLDARAERLAARLLSGQIVFTEDELKAPSIHTIGGLLPYERESRTPKHCPVFLRHLAHWLPPPGIYDACHPDDRESCTTLHRLAYEAASACVTF